MGTVLKNTVLSKTRLKVSERIIRK